MGACYSKSACDTDELNSYKPPTIKTKDSKKAKKKFPENFQETVPLQESGDEDTDLGIFLEQCPGEKNTVPINHQISRTSTPEFPSDHTDEKTGDRGVAPSDSGVESIGTAPEEFLEHGTSKPVPDELNKKLERLSRGSCSKCGNFKLDDSAFTALLADTYCSCGPRQPGKPSINPQCQTHGQKKQIIVDKNGLKSSLKNPCLAQKDKNLRISIRSAERLDMALTLLSSAEKSRYDISDKCAEEYELAQAPLAHFDSIDTVLNDTPNQRNQKRRSLLSEILDITDSICRCDFYSNEYCCPQAHDENIESDFLSVVSESNHEQCVATEMDKTNYENHGKNILSLQETDELDSDSIHNMGSANKKSTSLPKNVSFATAKADEIDPLSQNAAPQIDSSKSEMSSGIFTNSSTSEPYLHRAMKKAAHKRTLSLSSRGVVLSDSSSEALNDGTEDDLASLDLDSLSRATSLSYSSIRQLVESTEDLVSLDNAVRMNVDGVDCVVIPSETFCQMQTDLATLKQQLLCLSSLIQEVCDRAGAC
ncbi:unnamed protein product [Lymnaea stagnalis]|uniref:Uncharacterized protein n=1 Tax=Lymnaea stagnalis TaxID=6523 RepID=A0AAV2HT11_LYMST